jgi:lipoprotein-anchoring transpeptidase ErfK/SrfK
VSVGVRRACFVVASVAAGALVVGACTSGHSGGPDSPTPVAHAQSSTSASSATSKPPAPPARLVAHPANGTHGVSPSAPISVTVADGTLTAVTMTNDEGKAVKGAISADHSAWHVGEDLGYGKAYTVQARAVNADGKPVARVSHFTTLTPDNMTMPYLNTTGGTSIHGGATYGVGMVISVHFDEAISDKAAAEKALHVTSSPPQPGGWYWMDAQNVHFRPAHYWKSGTKVSVAAKVYGVQMAPGMYGQADAGVSFKIGASHVSVADDKTKIVTVYQNGKIIKKMPTSMGKGGSEVSNGNTITFWTQPGTYTVLDQANPVRMDSRSFGLALDAGGYNVLVDWATRISTDGIYLHSAPWSVWAQGNTDTSHGCLNLSPENAEWFYNWAQPGDVVQVKNTGGAPLQVWQNGDWSVPWAKWKAGSALN